MAKFDVAGLIAALKNVSSSDKIALGEALGFPAAKEKKVSNRAGPTVFNAEVAAIRLEMPELSRQEAMKEASRRRDAASARLRNENGGPGVQTLARLLRPPAPAPRGQRRGRGGASGVPLASGRRREAARPGAAPEDARRRRRLRGGEGRGLAAEAG